MIRVRCIYGEDLKENVAERLAEMEARKIEIANKNIEEVKRKRKAEVFLGLH